MACTEVHIAINSYQMAAYGSTESDFLYQASAMPDSNPIREWKHKSEIDLKSLWVLKWIIQVEVIAMGNAAWHLQITLH